MWAIRCPNKFFGTLTTKSSGVLRIRCNSRFCKTDEHGENQVVEHYWDLAETQGNSVKLIDTRRFKDPTKGNRK